LDGGRPGPSKLTVEIYRRALKKGQNISQKKEEGKMKGGCRIEERKDRFVGE